MRIVFLTNKSARGAEILKHMKSRNVPIEAIFVDIERGHLRQKFKKVKRIGPLETYMLILKRIRKILLRKTQKEWQSNDFFYTYSDQVYTVHDFNGEHCERLLKEIRPDIIILGGSRIIRQNIIQIPEIGILNAHPGLLPKYRGVDVIPWAIYHGDPIGVTIHFIDEGVDTGRIVAQKLIEVTAGDTLGRLMKKANRIAGELMADSVLTLMQKGHIQQKPQARESGTQYYRMPLTLRQETERKLEQMIADSKPKRA